MKLGILIPRFPQLTHIFFWREIKALESLGVDVELLSTRRAAREDCPHDFTDEAAARTHYVAPADPGAVLVRAMRNLRGLAKSRAYIAGLSEADWKGKIRAACYAVCGADLAHHCKRRNIAHIHVHSCAEAAHVAAMSLLWGGPSYSLQLHGDLPVYGVDHGSKMEHAAFVSADARPMQQQVITQIGIPAHRTYTIWMGVDTDRFIPSERTTGSNCKIHAVTVARLHRAKGHCHALEALRRVLQRGLSVKYTIAGSGPFEENIRCAIEELGLRDHVEMAGALDESQVLDLLQSADMFILPSVGLGEASPVAVMEAMSCGLPVVSSIIGGTPDMITDGVDGLLIDKHDEKGLAEALIRLAQNPEERRRLGVAARKRALESFDVRGTASRLLHAIRSHTGLAFSDRKPR